MVNMNVNGVQYEEEEDEENNEYENEEDCSQSEGEEEKENYVDEEEEKERQEIIDSFPLHRYRARDAKSVNCSICLDKFKAGDLVKTLECLHTFHQKCLDPWLHENLVCPLCRNPLVEEC
eukprot:TRINITY_DN17018_c0_g2_i7.p3 TRINITY_DN17018_c0_g2~~TRINITY_DN17018_c0_g2_i7.p3  ORF type:complete len:120 (+),score=49.56 TRINITY_DN17018_c0_g2_i7:205-564(+)